MEIEQMLGGANMMAGGVNSLGPAVPQIDASVDQDDEQRKKVAKDFESIFIHQLMETMKATIPEEDSEDCASGQVKSMYWSFMSDAISDQGGLGLWKDIAKNMADNAGASEVPQASDRVNDKV